MIKYIYLLIFTIPFILNSQPRNLDSKDHSIMINTSLQTNPVLSVELTWNLNELASSYGIFRKELGTSNFPANALVELDSGIIEWTDTGVEAGKIYEYQIRSLFNANTSSGVGSFQGVGYKAVSVMADPYPSGKILILVDNTIMFPLSVEIERLVEDLKNEGWFVVLKQAERAEEYNSEAVQNTKQLIVDENSVGKLDMVFLLGRIAVPYSGGFDDNPVPPDGHTYGAGDHVGAWPADLYYGDLNEFVWKDEIVNISDSRRDINNNIPGDGKFDIHVLGSDVDIAIGRVDFYDLPAFAETEVELYRAYLNKNHSYRTGEMEIVKRGLIDDNFPARNMLEGFASNGWRNFGSLIDKDSIRKADWFTALENENYLFAYGTGAGSFTSCSGVGNTTNFTEQDVNAVFTMLFGSYFGDWDSKNNLMRAALASGPSILTCAWAARPHWFMHHMGLNYPIGYSTLVSQNNNTEYYPNLTFLQNRWLIYGTSIRGTHNALMGDPSLRMYSLKELASTAPRSGLVEQIGFEQINVDWEDPDDDGIHFWDLFRATEAGEWTKINSEPISSSEYLDDFNYEGIVYYQVRERVYHATENMQQNLYSNALNLEILMQDLTSIDELTNTIQLSPNPSSDFVDIRVRGEKLGEINIEIVDLSGRLIKSFKTNSIGNGEYFIKWDLRSNGNKVPRGLYIVNFKYRDNFISKKLIVR